MKIGIVCGEASGDLLAAGLIKALKHDYPHADFVGIGGERMMAEGFESLFPLERLSVMGLLEPLKRLPELLSIRSQLYKHFRDHEFDLFIGVDSPDFNLGLERKLKQQGIKIVHYVSPSVWAWRQGRINKIKRSIDLMLTLLPFENAIYQRHQVPVTFVGHPLADHFPVEPDNEAARAELSRIIAGITDRPVDYAGKKILACLPGSRQVEIKHIGPVFWQALAHYRALEPALEIIVPALNHARYQQLQQQLSACPELPVTLIKGYSHQVMAASDAVLLASGTTALEAMLLKKPMVVAYKKDPVSYKIISSMLRVPYVSLPNLLADKPLVPELIQSDARPQAIVKALSEQLNNPQRKQQLHHEFEQLHQQLKQNASQTAAKAIVNLMGAEYA
ncbi:MAG: lipid-A-disaccharide synthase [Pseudomonadota bacterium]